MPCPTGDRCWASAPLTQEARSQPTQHETIGMCSLLLPTDGLGVARQWLLDTVLFQ